MSAPMTGFDLKAPLGSLLAADRPTVLVITRPGCTECEATMRSLRTHAFENPAYSLLLIGVPQLDSRLADVAVADGVSAYATPSLDELLPVGGDAVVVALTPDGGVLGTWPLDAFERNDLTNALSG